MWSYHRDRGLLSSVLTSVHELSHTVWGYILGVHVVRSVQKNVDPRFSAKSWTSGFLLYGTVRTLRRLSFWLHSLCTQQLVQWQNRRVVRLGVGVAQRNFAAWRPHLSRYKLPLIATNTKNSMQHSMHMSTNKSTNSRTRVEHAASVGP